MAGFFYTIGCSLMHMGMLITLFFVKRPNFEKARALDDQYFENINSIE